LSLKNNMAGKINQFNIVIFGIGGQGQITLLQILAEAAVLDEYDVKTSELHGLSQRGGSVEVHIRFGKEIFSPLVPKAKGDLILALELQEALKGLYFANEKTKFLVNDYFSPILGANFSVERDLKVLGKLKKRLFLIEASKVCQEKLGKEVLAGIYLISLASFKKLLPLKPNSILKAIEKIVPEKYLELNKNTFALAKEVVDEAKASSA